MSQLTDMPEEQDDLLNLSPMVDALHQYVRNSDTPTTIGIQGDWGVGKTSMLMMLKQRLEADTSNPIVPLYLNTWQYSQFTQQEHIVFSLFDAILDKVKEISIGENQKLDKLRSSLKRAFYIAATSGSQLLKKQTGIDVEKSLEGADKSDQKNLHFFNIAKELSNYRADFEILLNTVTNQKKGMKFLIIIDDLDRLKPSTAMDIMESFKNFMDVRHCIFILAVDYEIIQRGVEEKFGSATRQKFGKSFFDKIIQLPFNMPVSSYNIGAYIMSLLGWNENWSKDKFDGYLNPKKERYLNLKSERAKGKISLNDLKKDDYNYFERICRIITAGNPRSIKRIANYANLLRLIYTEDGYFRDLKEASVLFSLACLQMEWPEILRFIAENPGKGTLNQLQTDLLEEVPAFKTIFDRVPDKEKFKAKIDAFFEEFMVLLEEKDQSDKNQVNLGLLWSIIKKANLGSMEYITLDITLNRLGKNYKFLEFFKKSNWNNENFLTVQNQTKSISILSWSGQEIAYLVVRKHRATLYLKEEPDFFIENAELVDVVTSGKYHSYGKSIVNIDHKTDPKQAIPQLNNILKELVGDSSEELEDA